MSKVFIDESTLTDIGDAIRDKEGSSEKIPTTQMAERILGLRSSSELQIAKSFTVHSLNDFGKAKVELELPKAGSLANFCNVSEAEHANHTVQELTIRCEQKPGSIYGMLYCANADAADSSLKKLTLLVDTGEATQCQTSFYRLTELEEILGTPLDFSSATALGGVFSYCDKLREVRFKGTISKDMNLRWGQYSKETFYSLFAALSAETTGTALTTRRYLIDQRFESAEGAADGSSSAEWTALVDSRPNWTISLV